MNLQWVEEIGPILGGQEFCCELLELGQNEQEIKCWEWWKEE